MSRARTTGLSAGEAVLGLVIEQPDRGFGLERRLDQRFPAARFAYSTAYSALRRLQKDGLVRAVKTGGNVRGAGAGGAEARGAGEEVTFEATPKGVEHFRNWIREPTSAPIPREELHAKISLCDPRDLPRLIDTLHTEELACIAELDRIRERMVAERRDAARSSLAEEGWSELMDRGVVHGEAAFWGGRITQLAHLRNYLESLRAEAERRALAAHRRELQGGLPAGRPQAARRAERQADRRTG
jgi:DNA-binding PadR family transcriptional regulator